MLGSGGNDPVTLTCTYASAGWPRTIVHSGSTGTISSETLYYEQSNGEASNAPRWDSLLSAVDYNRTTDGVDYHWTFGYDANARLASATLAGSDTRGYQFDDNGNLTTLTVGSDATKLTYDGSNILRSAGSTAFTTAPSGEVTGAGSLGFAYDFNSRLTVTVSDADSGTTMTLSFGSGAQRLRKDVSDGGGNPTAWRRYMPGPRQHALQEQYWDAAPNQTSEIRYIRGPHGIVALQAGGTDYCVLHDHERSPRIVLSGASASPVALLDYLPFGSALKTGGTDPDLMIYRYTGQEWDSETGLYNYRHRLYDPALARFYAPDPRRQYFSPYVYVADHPLLLADPSGEITRRAAAR